MFSKIFKDERGVAFVLELLVICIVVGGVGFIGYSVYQNNKQASDPLGVDGRKVPSQTPQELVSAHNRFGFSLLKSISTEDTDKNIFISPPSVSLALSMAYNGAGADTKTAMAETLQLQNLSIDQVNLQSRGLLNGLRKSDKDITLSIANSAWIREKFDVKPAFLNTVKDYYEAEASMLDFDSPDASETINDWVNTHTDGKIPAIVDDDIPSDARMYLINATYFKASWTTEFNKNSTHDATFTPSDSAAVKRPFMVRTEQLPYLETADFQSVSLPYGKNKKMSMYVFLPKDLAAFTQKLDSATWNQWMDEYKTVQGTVMLPKFKLEYEKSLKSPLAQIGMGVAFTDRADFTGIDKNNNLLISEVKHKTYLDVNEAGTEASAATSIEFDVKTSVSSEGFTMNVNRPFFIAIRDNTTQELLFTGLIKQP